MRQDEAQLICAHVNNTIHGLKVIQDVVIMFLLSIVDLFDNRPDIEPLKTRKTDTFRQSTVMHM